MKVLSTLLRSLGAFLFCAAIAVGDQYTLLASPPLESRSSRPAKIFSDTTYHIIQKGRLYGQTERTVSVVSIGCGVLIDDGHGPLLVTAAHVVAGDPSPTQITVMKDGTAVETITTGTRVWVESANFTVSVSNLSLRPVSVFLDRDNDLALLQLSGGDLKLMSAPIFTARDAARVGQRVIAWGFHDSPDAQLEEARVSDLGHDFFTINRPMDPGFSGGPVVDEAGMLLGVIDRSTDKQTRCISADAVWRFIQQNRDRLVPVSDHMDLSGRNGEDISTTQPHTP